MPAHGKRLTWATPPRDVATLPTARCSANGGGLSAPSSL
eukprot:CAMPEP_0197917270 /NCGR_PEP_ID=MMETSP1439-20131203/83549_1 /TAXON_ID=66791 /ORGANISM="Gonyaulax spinifera, Strain CCMP409" /LENGTH=38 /DNA_ID= /DNA_START= /DNA_END= /DNA_ORIENTATION=